MTVVASLSKLLPSSLICPGVESIVAAVAKPIALHDAERALAERVAFEASLTKRLGEIEERLNFRSPLPRMVLSKTEQDELEAERIVLNRKVLNARTEAGELRRQVAGLMQEHARSVAASLAPFRRSAAEQLLDAVSLAEQALADIDKSNKALTSVGIAPPAAFALPLAAALKALAEKVIMESRNGS
ncbi:hypothetical protein AB7M17_005265 [Bradyrhizobium sp. USDA 377]